MRVKVQLFARLREIAGTDEWTCEAASGASLADVWREVSAAHPGLAEFSAVVSAALNEDFAPMSARVADGDSVAFLPPVSGGAARNVEP
jgi:molybdopterin converting factor subunit 1